MNTEVDDTNVQGKLIQMICDFQEDVVSHVEADGDAKSLFAKVRPMYKAFIEKMAGTQPRFAVVAKGACVQYAFLSMRYRAPFAMSAKEVWV